MTIQTLSKTAPPAILSAVWRAHENIVMNHTIQHWRGVMAHSRAPPSGDAWLNQQEIICQMIDSTPASDGCVPDAPKPDGGNPKVHQGSTFVHHFGSLHKLVLPCYHRQGKRMYQ